jgi:glutamyl-tRNA(Gln) amidotransferase subunit D
MLPETALVKLMWILGQTSDAKEAERLLKTDIAGELAPRTLAEKTGDQ